MICQYARIVVDIMNSKVTIEKKIRTETKFEA